MLSTLRVSWLMCPHCRVAFFERPDILELGTDTDGNWFLRQETCPTCKRLIFELLNGTTVKASRTIRQTYSIESVSNVKMRQLVRPKGSLRPPPSSEVPKQFAEEYVESSLVLPDSPKASAALSRRCLQNLLREEAKVKQSDLANEIQQLLDSKALPSKIAEMIDAVRNIGNFAAHPIKSTSTGEIMPVEPGEADWNLDVLEALFDFYFVQPAVVQKKKDALNKKLAEAGKPPMK